MSIFQHNMCPGYHLGRLADNLLDPTALKDVVVGGVAVTDWDRSSPTLMFTDPWRSQSYADEPPDLSIAERL